MHKTSEHLNGSYSHLIMPEIEEQCTPPFEHLKLSGKVISCHGEAAHSAVDGYRALGAFLYFMI